MGRAASLLIGLRGPDRRRALAAAALAALLGLYDSVADRLPGVPLAVDTAITALFSMPAAFAKRCRSCSVRAKTRMHGSAR